MPKSLKSPRHELVKSALIKQRKAVGMTQAEVADRLGRAQSYIAKIEGGERRVDIVELVGIAEVIGLDLAELVGDLRRTPAV